MHEDHVRVVLDLEAAGETIRGSISTSSSGSKTFFGWLELAHALEVARNGQSTLLTASPHTDKPA